MTGPPRLSAVSIAAAALLAAVTAGAQVPSAEQRAFDALGRAISGIETATGRRTPLGVMTSAMSLSVQAGTSTLS